MSERDGYEPGVPCWVETRQPDPHIWVDSADETVARVMQEGGRVVTAPFDLAYSGRTAVLADPAGAEFSVWQPVGHFWVDDTDATAERAAELGGTAIVPPFDILIGRTAILADPQGATFSISRVVPA